MPIIQTMKSAQQIYNYLPERLDTSDENIRELLKKINYRASTEKDYELGKDAQGAKMVVRDFVKHGNRVFTVNRNEPAFICHACGKEQKSFRLYASPAPRSSVSDHSRRAVRPPLGRLFPALRQGFTIPAANFA